MLSSLIQLMKEMRIPMVVTEAVVVEEASEEEEVSIITMES